MQGVSTENSDGKANPPRRRAPRAKAEAATPRQLPRAATRRVSTTRAKVEREPAAAAPLRGVPSAPPAVTSSPLPTDLPDDRYFNRELSWLDFNARVLALAEDSSQPLLERAKFLAIFASNLDEFYMVRVAGLKRRAETGLTVRSADGLTPLEQLVGISKRSQELVEQHARAFLDHIRPGLEQHQISIVTWGDLTDYDRMRLSNYFSEQVFPVLTPLAVDPAHPFPYISGLSLNLAVVIRNPKTGKDHFARVKVPPNFTRFVPLGNQRFVPLEDIIGEHLKRLFPGMEVLEVHSFRVTRNEDLEVEEDDAENLLAALEKE
ncbi:MAG TPA: RNA degradosome polyphosphate kinase, partial [Lentzea sp.]|nr:RNA degradosome polyphosphate kinase [Lentzea sp.]